MQDSQAVDFYNRIVEGQDYVEEIELTHESGDAITIEVHPVDKQTLASVIQSLPEDMFDAMEEAENADEAEELIEEEEDVSLDVMSDQTVDAFERLVKESVRHPDLTSSQMDTIVEDFNFETLFELGGEIIDMSFAKGGAIKDFRKAQ
jgi:hypothetical protein